jgi:5-hydroxyisourate hydrolase
MRGCLTTHVLDLTQGLPAGGLKIELWRIEEEGARILIQTVNTNHDGRVDAPLLAGDEWQPGVYELVFFVAAYFHRQGSDLTEPPFLDRVPVRFGIANLEAHYHVPLLVAPGGYSTYRGS